MTAPSNTDLRDYFISNYGESRTHFVADLDELIQAREQQLLTELLGELPDDAIITTKYGYNSDEKKYGYRIGVTEAKLAINAKLKQTNDGGN